MSLAVAVRLSLACAAVFAGCSGPGSRVDDVTVAQRDRGSDRDRVLAVVVTKTTGRFEDALRGDLERKLVTRLQGMFAGVVPGSAPSSIPTDLVLRVEIYELVGQNNNVDGFECHLAVALVDARTQQPIARFKAHGTSGYRVSATWQHALDQAAEAVAKQLAGVK